MNEQTQRPQQALQHVSPPHQQQPAPAPAPSKPATDLLAEIVNASLGPLSRLCESIDMTLRQMSDWIAKPENRRDIFNIQAVFNAQTELLMAQHRVTAAATLIRLTQDENAGPETVRRAAKDLLLIRAVERTRPRGQGLRGGDDMEPLPLPERRRTFKEMEKELKDWAYG